MDTTQNKASCTRFTVQRLPTYHHQQQQLAGGWSVYLVAGYLTGTQQLLHHHRQSHIDPTEATSARRVKWAEAYRAQQSLQAAR